MPELNVSRSSVPDTMGNRDESTAAIPRSKDGKIAVSRHSIYGGNHGSTASISRGAALQPPDSPMSICKVGNDIPPAGGGGMPPAPLQEYPVRSSYSAKMGENTQEKQSEENLQRTLPTSRIPPPPSVLSGCSVAKVHNNLVERNRVDPQTDNNVLNSVNNSQSKDEDSTKLVKVHMKNTSHPQTQTATICNRLESSDIQNRVPRIDIPKVAVDATCDQGASRKPVYHRSIVSQGPQESATSQSICSTYTQAGLIDSSNSVSKTTTHSNTATTQDKGQVSMDVSGCRISEIAGSNVTTHRSVTSNRSLQGKNDDPICSSDQKHRDEQKGNTFMSEYEKYVTAEKDRCMTKQLKSISSKSLVDHPTMLRNDHSIKAALLGQNSLEREYQYSNYGIRDVPSATTLKEMVQRQLVASPGKPGGIDNSNENSTTITLLHSPHMRESAIDSLAGYTQSLGLMSVSSLQNPSLQGQSIASRRAFPHYSATVQYSTPVTGSMTEHLNRSNMWGKQTKGNTDTFDHTQSSTPVTVLDMSTGASAPSVEIDTRGRGQGRGSRTRGGGRRTRGVKRIGANKTGISTIPKSKDEDYGGMDSLDPLQIDDPCTQPKKRGSRGSRIRGGRRVSGRGRWSLSQEANSVVPVAGSTLSEEVALDFSKAQIRDQGEKKQVRRRKPKSRALTGEMRQAYVDLTESGIDSMIKHAPNISEAHSPFASRNDRPGSDTSHHEVIERNQDGSSSSVDTDMLSTTKRSTSHSTIKSLINQPTLQPIPPCSRDHDRARTSPLVMADRRRENNVTPEPVVPLVQSAVQHMNQHHLHQNRHVSPLITNHPLVQSVTQNMVRHQSPTLPTLANVLTPDKAQNEPISAQLQTQSTPDLVNVLSNNRPTVSLQSTRVKLGQFLNSRKSDPPQTNVIDLTEDTGASATTSERMMSQAANTSLEQPMRRQSCPDLHSSIPVPVCQMSKDTISIKPKDKEIIFSRQAPVLLPKDMFCSTTRSSEMSELRQQHAQSSAAMQSPTVVGLLNRRPVHPSSARPPRHLSPAHQGQRKETLRLTRMLTPPAAHTRRCPSDILIEPAPPDISAIHVEMIHQRNEEDSRVGSCRKNSQGIPRYSTESTSVPSDKTVLCPHGHKCMCTPSKASSPDIQVLDAPIPSVSNSIHSHSHTKSKPVEYDQMEASNLTVQRKKSTSSKPASIPNSPMPNKFFGTIPKAKCMTTCAHQFIGQSTHGIGFPHCAHTSACPKVTLQQKCCQHLTGVPPPAHSNIPIETLLTTPLDLTAEPPQIVEDSLNLSLKDDEISATSLDKQRIDPLATQALNTNADGLSYPASSPQPLNFSGTLPRIVEKRNSPNTSAGTRVPDVPEFSRHNTIIQTSINTKQQQVQHSNEPQLQIASSSVHLQHPITVTSVKEGSQQSETVTDQDEPDKVLLRQKELENIKEDCPDLTSKPDPMDDTVEKLTTVNEKKQDRPKQKKSTKVNINKIDLEKLAKREQQLKGRKKVTRKPNQQTPETEGLPSSITPVVTTQENSQSDTTNSETALSNIFTDLAADRIIDPSRSSSPGTEAESGPDTGKRSPVQPTSSLNKHQKKKNNAVKAKKDAGNDSPKAKGRKSVSLHLDTNVGIAESPQTGRPKRAAVTFGGYKKECTCPACINYDVPKRRRSKESASGNSTPSTPSTPSIPHVAPLLSTNSEAESTLALSAGPIDGHKHMLSDIPLDEVNKHSQTLHAVQTSSTSTDQQLESKEPPSKHELEAVVEMPTSNVVESDREIRGQDSPNISPNDGSKGTRVDMSPNDIDKISLSPSVVETEISSSISLTAVTHIEKKEAEPKGTIQEVDIAVPLQALDMVSSKGDAEMISKEAQIEIEGMAGLSVQTEEFPKEHSETQNGSFAENVASDDADVSTELGLVITSVVGGFTDGPSNDGENAVKGELNGQQHAEISDSGHFSLSDAENILRLPESETDSPEEASEHVLGTVIVKHDGAEEPHDEAASQDSIKIKTEISDEITEELAERSESNQNAVNSNSDTDSDLPSFYSYLSAGNPGYIQESFDMQIEGQTTPSECAENVGNQTGRKLKKRTKARGKKRQLTRRKRKWVPTDTMVPPAIIYENIDELPDIKHHIVIQDYSTIEKEAITGNEEVIDLETGKEQVPDFATIAIKREPVDDTYIYHPLIKQCSIVLQKIQSVEPYLQELTSKQSQSRKRKSSSLSKAHDQTKARKTSKRAAKVVLEIADNVEDSTEAGSLCAMKTADHVIKSEPSYDEASTDAYSDGGVSAQESEDDECNLKVLLKNGVKSNKLHDQASSNIVSSENTLVVDQIDSKDVQASSEAVPPSSQDYLQPNKTSYALAEDNLERMADVCDAENVQALTVNEADSNTLLTENTEADSSTNLSYLESTSDQKDDIPDHPEQEDDQSQTENKFRQQDGTSDKEKNQLIDQELTKIPIPDNEKEEVAGPVNAVADKSKSDENEQSSKTVDETSEVQSPEGMMVDGYVPGNVPKKSLIVPNELQEGSVAETEGSVPDDQSTDLPDPVNLEMICEEHSCVSIMNSVNEQVENPSSEPQPGKLNLTSPKSRGRKSSTLPNTNNQPNGHKTGTKEVALEVADKAKDTNELGTVCALEITKQITIPIISCDRIVSTDGHSSVDIAENSYLDATPNTSQEAGGESGSSKCINQTAKKDGKTAAQKRLGGKQKTLMSDGHDSENLIKNYDDTPEKQAVTENEHPATDVLAAGHDAVTPIEEAGGQGEKFDLKTVNTELSKGLTSTESTSREQSDTCILESDAPSKVVEIDNKEAPPKRGTKTAAKRRATPKRKIPKSKGPESVTTCEKIIKNQDDTAETIKEKAVLELECSQHENPISNLLGAGHNPASPLVETREKLKKSNELEPASVELRPCSSMTESTSSGQLLTYAPESVCVQQEKATNQPESPSQKLPTIRNLLDTASKGDEMANKRVTPANKAAKKATKKRSGGKRKIPMPKDVESGGVYEKPIENQDDAIQEAADTESGCSQNEHPTTSLLAAVHDAANPLKESEGQVQTSNQVEPAIEEHNAGSCIIESTSEEQPVTGISTPESKQHMNLANKPESPSQKTQPKAPRTSAKNRSGGKQNMLTSKEHESETLRPSKDMDDTKIQQETITESVFSENENPTMHLSVATTNKHTKTATKKRTAGKQKLLTPKGPVTESLSESPFESLAVTNTNIQQEDVTEPVQLENEKSTMPLPVATASKLTKTAAKKQMGGKQKLLTPKVPVSESLCEKTIENPDGTNSKIQEEAVTGSVHSENENLTSHLTVTAASKGAKTAVKKRSTGKQKKLAPEVPESESLCEKVLENLDDTNNKIQQEATTELVRSENVTSHLPVATANKGAKAAAKKRSAGKQKMLSVKGIESESLCEKPIENLEDTATKHQDEALPESVCPVVPPKKGIKTAGKKRSGGKQKMTEPKALESESHCEEAKNGSENVQTRHEEGAVTKSVCSEHEYPTTNLPVAPTNKGTLAVAKKRRGRKQKLTKAKALKSKSLCEEPKSNTDDNRNKQQEGAVTESESPGHEHLTTDSSGNDAVKSIEQGEGQGSTQVQLTSAKINPGSNTESISPQQTVINVLGSGGEQQLKVTNPPIRNLLETGTKGFKTYKVTKKAAKKGEKRKILTFGALASDSKHDKVSKKLKFEDLTTKSKNMKKTEQLKRCFVRVVRLDDEIIDSLKKGSYNCKLLAPPSSSYTAPPTCPDQKPKEDNYLLAPVFSTDPAPQTLPDHELEEENDLLTPIFSTDPTPPSCSYQELEDENELESFDMDDIDNTINQDKSIAKTADHDHESLLEMLQRQVLENHSISVHDNDNNSPVSDKASSPEDDSMMPPLSPKVKRDRRQTDKQSPLWDYLATVGYRKRKL